MPLTPEKENALWPDRKRKRSGGADDEQSSGCRGGSRRQEPWVRAMKQGMNNEQVRHTNLHPGLSTRDKTNGDKGGARASSNCTRHVMGFWDAGRRRVTAGVVGKRSLGGHEHLVMNGCYTTFLGLNRTEEKSLIPRHSVPSSVPAQRGSFFASPCACCVNGLFLCDFGLHASSPESRRRDR